MILPPFTDNAWFFCANLITVVEGYVLIHVSNNSFSIGCGLGAICFGALGMGWNIPNLLNL